MMSRIGDINPKGFSGQVKLLPEFFSEDTGVAPRISEITPQRFGDQLQFFPEPFGKATGVASAFGNLSTK